MGRKFLPIVFILAIQCISLTVKRLSSDLRERSEVADESEYSSDAPVSAILSLGDSADLSALASTLRAKLEEAGSTPVSVKGSGPAIAGLLSEFEGQAVSVSARISLRADKDAKG
ncbi:hypothetical protein [Streptomyces sp. NPDC090131]|uniref:hypothetical protein n=1 Tax=Streptomyces sp. NPDC090131 TaxID=3365954 RepID=UPI0038309BA6